MTQGNSTLARGIVKHVTATGHRQLMRELDSGKRRPFLERVRASGGLIDKFARAPQPGLKGGTTVIHFGRGAAFTPNGLRFLPEVNVWATLLDKRGRPLNSANGAAEVTLFHITQHAWERFIERTATHDLDTRPLYDEFRGAMSKWARMALHDQLQASEDRAWLVTGTGAGPIGPSGCVLTFEQDGELHQLPVPGILTWIPDKTTRHENQRRLTRIEEARAAGQVCVNAL